MIESELCVTETRQQDEYDSLKSCHSFCKEFTKAMMKQYFPDELEIPPEPVNVEDLSDWAKAKEDAKRIDIQKGFIFGTPPREASFDDSFECALFLAENGFYTQAMVLLRTALNNVLSTSMKQIVQAIPSRLDESKYLQKMFGTKRTNKLDHSLSRSAVGSRAEFTLTKNEVSIRNAIRELLDVGFIEEPIIEFQFIKKREGIEEIDDCGWVSKFKLNVEQLNGHVHAHDGVVDRFRVEDQNPAHERERKFSGILWKEFQSTAFAILDLKMCIAKSLHKAALNIYIKGTLPKAEAERLRKICPAHYVPNFGAGNPAGWVGTCIDCKVRKLTISNMKVKNFICGNCKKELESL